MTGIPGYKYCRVCDGQIAGGFEIGWDHLGPSPEYTDPGHPALPKVPCGACGEDLTDEEILLIWTDRDFFYHLTMKGADNHYMSIDEDHKELYYGVAKALTVQVRIATERWAAEQKALGEAQRIARSYLTDLATHHIDRANNYSHEQERAERIMMDGNGPTVYAVFLFSRPEGEPTTAFFEYVDAHATALVHIPDEVAPRLYRSLTTF